MRLLTVWMIFVSVALSGAAKAQDAPPPTDGAAIVETPVGDPVEIAEDPQPNVPADESAATVDAEDSAEDAVVEVPPEPTEDAAATDDETAAEDAAASTDWAGLLERAPAFLANTHHAAVHMPIALWMFGAFFVVVGVVVPSLRNQIPLACLIGGALTSVAAAASGWWYAEYSWGEPWTWADGFGDWSEHLVKHRWMGVALVFVSLGLSVVAIVSQVKKSRRLGLLWRLGLIGLAAAVAWEGHLGGELIQGEGFLEDAFQEWVNPEGAD